MDTKEFRKYAHELVDWMADYLEQVEKYPVRSLVKPGETKDQLPDNPPEVPHSFENIFKDFEEKIIPGMTHWQHPSFFAYFPASRSEPSILAEMLTATLGAQCMMWATSPAAAELEEQMMEWLKKMLDLPRSWKGVIQDTASTATLCALLTAREVISGFKINESGFDNNKYRIYCSEQAHSSVDKAVMMAGFGRKNLVKIEVDENYAMKTGALQSAIKNDLKSGFKPAFIVGALGTTGSTAIDPIDKIGEIAQKFGIWYHIDAAYAGSALIIDEFRNQFKSLELADSFVFNPHKWMFTNFDCSVYFIKDAGQLIRSFEVLPEYLKTKSRGSVNDYRDWGVPLGRRFRSLKLWFVMRSFGISGIQERLRFHIRLNEYFSKKISGLGAFEVVMEPFLNFTCFRLKPEGLEDMESLNNLNEQLLEEINRQGKLFLTHTKINGQFTLRMVIGQTYVEQQHVDRALDEIKRVGDSLET